MIDVYRLILALFVVQGHLLGFGPSWLAWQAVFSFYVLSGFLMTLVLNETYGFGPGAFMRFAANRALRLFPSYLIVIGASALYILFIAPLGRLNGALDLPKSSWEIVSNISMIGLAGIDAGQMMPHRLSPSAWSINVELVCYALLALGLARSRISLLIFLMVGIGIAASHFVGISAAPPADYGFQDHYSVLQAGFIPFAAGGLAYFYRDSPIFAPTKVKIGAIAVLYALNAAGGYVSPFHANVSGLYVAVLLNVALTPMLFRLERAPSSGKPGLTRILGGIAYPLFISHWLVGTLVAIHVTALEPKSLSFFLVATGSTIVLSLVLYLGVDRNVDRLRSLIKKRRRPAPHDADAREVLART